MVREFQRVIGDEARQQVLSARGPAAGGGGGLRRRRLERHRHLQRIHRGFGRATHRRRGRRAAARCWAITRRASTGGSPGVLQGTYSYVLQDEDGQIASDAFGLRRAGLSAVGPEHSCLREQGRAEYISVTDEAEALEAFDLLSAAEGIIPALESAHAVAYAVELARTTEGGGG